MAHTRVELMKMPMKELESMAQKMDVKIVKDKDLLVARLFLRLKENARGSKSKPVVFNPRSLTGNENRAFRNRNSSTVNPITMEEPEFAERHKYIMILMEEKHKTYVYIDDFIKLISDPKKRFYEIKRTKKGERYEKYIEKSKTYVNISLPFNAIVRENDLMNINKSGFQVYFLEKTSINLGELISVDVANYEGSLVGSHHGGDTLYHWRKMERP
jgi:hypothetical protein